jgi:hypothetical protein
LQLIVRQIAPPQEHNDQIGVFNRGDARNTLPIVGIDETGLWIDREQDPAVEPVMLCQNFPKLGKRLFGTVFFVAGNQHNALSVTGAIVAFVMDPLIAGVGSRDKKKCGYQPESGTITTK